MISHRTKDRRKPFQSGVLVCVCGLGVTFQNISLSELPLMDDLRANTEDITALQISRFILTWLMGR